MTEKRVKSKTTTLAIQKQKQGILYVFFSALILFNYNAPNSKHKIKFLLLLHKKLIYLENYIAI